MISSAKISIIGAGFVGSACADELLNQDLGDIVLLDIDEGLAKGKALDLWHSSALTCSSARIVGTSDYRDIQDSDIVIITAGKARGPGMTREGPKKHNAEIIKSSAEQIKKWAPNSYVIVVTNPLDIMAYVAYKSLGFPSNRVMGMAGVLDSARFRVFVAKALGVHPQDVQAFVLGEHGSSMVILPRLCHVGGVSLPNLLPASQIQQLVKRAQNGGGEIVSLFKNGSAYYAPGKSVVEMVRAILKDQKRVLACSTYLNGDYGVEDLFIGATCIIGAKGVQGLIDNKLTVEELRQFQDSASAIKKQLEGVV